MPTTPKMYFEFFVEENYRDFLNSPGSLRKGFNAAVSAFNMADVFYKYSKKHEPGKVSAWPKRRDFIIHLSKTEPQFNIVQSVTTIYKHMYVAEKYLDGSSPQSIRGFVDRDGVRVESAWRESRGKIVSLLRKDGSEAPLPEALGVVVGEMWPAYLR